MILPSNIASRLVKKIATLGRNTIAFNETEQEIIPLLIDNLSNKEIASKLNISYGTTRNYVSEIYKKVGADERSTAVEKLRNHTESML